jgi:hypothetical protein
VRDVDRIQNHTGVCNIVQSVLIGHPVHTLSNMSGQFCTGKPGSSSLVFVNIENTLEFSTRVVLYSNTHFTQPFLNQLVSSCACPHSLKYHAASSQASLKSCWALPPWAQLSRPDTPLPPFSHIFSCEGNIKNMDCGSTEQRDLKARALPWFSSCPD